LIVKLRAACIVPYAIALALAAGGCDQGTEPGHNHQPPPDGGTCGHVDSASGVELVYIHTGQTLVSQRGYTVTGELRVTLEEVLLHGIEVKFLDSRFQPIVIANDCELNYLTWTVQDDTVARITQDPGLRWFINVEPRRAGTTTLKLKINHDSHSHFESAAIPIVVEP
jgi:hypothetical protein